MNIHELKRKINENEIHQSLFEIWSIGVILMSSGYKAPIKERWRRIELTIKVK